MQRKLKKVKKSKIKNEPPKREKAKIYEAIPMTKDGKLIKVPKERYKCNENNRSQKNCDNNKNEQKSNNDLNIKRERKKYKKEQYKEFKKKILKKKIVINEFVKGKFLKYVAWEKRNGLPFKFRIFIGLSIIGCLWIWGIAAQIYGKVSAGLLSQINYNFFYCFVSIFTNGFKGVLVGAFANDIIITLLALWRYRNDVHKRETIQKERNGKIINEIIDDGSLATGHEATRDDLIKKFTLTTEPHRFKLPVYGIYEETGEYILGPEIKRNNENRNEFVLGAAGSGKSTRNILLKIYKFATRGENMVITDPSSELFKFTYLYLKNLGYKVQVINTRNPYRSNGWNPIAGAKQNFHMIQEIAETIINNAIKEQKDPFWPKQQANLLAALIGYSNFKYGEKSNIKLISNLVSDQGATPEKLKKMIERTLPKFHPARRCFNNFWNSETLRGRILNNLGTSLNIFYDPAIADMLSTNDIQIEEFGESEKSAIFIITAEADLTYSMIPSLFLDMCFKQLPDYAIDHNMATLKTPLHFICDEFANIGEIPEIGQKISVSRKYGLILHVVVQDMARFIQVYGNFELTTLIGNCWAVVVLGIEEQEDAEYFEKKFGDMSVETWQNSTDAPLLNTTSQQRTTPQKRPIYFANEITGMGRDYAMLYTSETNVCKIKKVDYMELQEYKDFKFKMGGKDEDTQLPINKYEGTVKPSEEYWDIVNNSSNSDNTDNTDNDKDYNEEGNETRENIESMWDDESGEPSIFNKGEGNTNKTKKDDKRNNKEKDNKEETVCGLYKENCEPKFIDYNDYGRTDDNQDIQLSLDGFISNENLDELNKIPTIKKRINWDPVLANYTVYIKKDEYNKMRFKKIKDFPELYNRQVFILSFDTSADFIKIKLPKDQIRAEGESIDISATTQYLMSIIDLPKKYYIDKWTLIINSEKKMQEISLGEIIPIPNKHITLVPHFDVKKEKKM